MKIILEGVTGSKAYGLDTAQSDTDIKGIFITPTEEILGLSPPPETHSHNRPDVEHHEVGKFIHLALKGNPTIFELLFLTDYTKLDEWGVCLIDNRKAFLSNAIAKTYGGYAMAQAEILNRRGLGHPRYAKHGRHCFRLLYQGKQLQETGELVVRVTPEVREELFAIGELPPDELIAKFREKFAEFNNIKSVLPDKPDYETVNKILLKIRKAH
jgi:predicted nucleotidyltransferase